MNEETGEYVCGICGERFDTEEELERHVHDVGIVD
jgi:DNA-directed RNA polymerase subunit RPC12/RpoP